MQKMDANQLLNDDDFISQISALDIQQLLTQFRTLEKSTQSTKQLSDTIISRITALEKDISTLLSTLDDIERQYPGPSHDEKLKDLAAKIESLDESIKNASLQLIDLEKEHQTNASNTKKLADIQAVISAFQSAVKPHHVWMNLYKESATNLADMIFIKEPKLIKDKPYIAPTLKKGEIIYNNDGYILGSDPTQNGKPLSLGKTPIGYNIHLPAAGTPIKNVIVKVYGGSQKGKGKLEYYPGSLDTLDQYLLSQGTVVISLNLPDLLKLNVGQGEMPESLHNEIQACIDKFYQTFKNSPELLHERLKELNLQDLEIFLYGGSFGGTTTITHAEKYPATFTGYISHDGA
jgi:hypothetical protein